MAKMSSESHSEVTFYFNLHIKLQPKTAARKYVMAQLMGGFKINCRKVRVTDIYWDIR